jgi:predicted RNase H-like HicB family nuclease
MAKKFQKEKNGSELMKQLNYRILLREEPEGGYTVIIPSLPGCVTYGDTIEEAIKMAEEAAELYIESLEAHKEEIPTEEKTLEYTLTVKAHA